MSLLLLIALSVVCLLTSCTRQPFVHGGSTPLREYQLRGTVLRLERRANRIAVLKHGPIKGWMEAMTMEFPVESEAEFRKLRVGDEITATVFVRDFDYWISKINIAK